MYLNNVGQLGGGLCTYEADSDLLGLVVVGASFVQINGLSFGVLCMHLVMMKAMTRQMHRLLLRG